MTSKPPAFQLYAADFYMDTLGWTCEEIGLYFRLLMAEWVNGALPNDEHRLSKICQMSVKKFHHNFKNVSPKFFQNDEGYLVNERLEKTREAQQQFIEMQREKGKKRAEQRWDGHIATAIIGLQPNGKPKHSSSSSSSNIKKEYTSDFLEFWKLYPNKRGSKFDAFGEWSKLNGARPPLQDIILSVQSQIKSRVGEDSKYWKHAERWIKGKCWESETPQKKSDPFKD